MVRAIGKILLVSAATMALSATFLLTAPSAPAYAQGSDEPTYSAKIDYAALDEILGAIVYRVGPSDRRPAFGAYQQTGSRIRRENTSRYRYEGNRVLFHLLNQEHRDELLEYRQALEALPNRVDIARLSRDEQLAFWLNLHNVVMLDTLARKYPVRNIAAARVNGAPLLEAEIVNLPDGAISLSSLRRDIILANWPDPRVLYGFYTGMVGGPSIQREAFNGTQVWTQLDGVASEFVNALRGVDLHNDPVRISPIYFEYDGLFPDGDSDVRQHLLRYAAYEVRDLVASAQAFRPLSMDTAIADLTNGAVCADGITGQLETYRDAGGDFNGGCRALPPIARDFAEYVEDRRYRLFREGRLGNVRVIDIPTEDSETPSPSPDSQ